MTQALVPLPVMLPLLGAGLALALWKHGRAQRVITVAVLALMLAVGVGLVVAADAGPVVVDVGGWSAPVGVVLVADRLSALMVTVSSLVLLCVFLYSLGQGIADGADEAPLAIYHPTYLVLAAGVSNAFLTGDLFNLYVGFEILLAASYVLLTLGGTRGRIRAGTIYVVVSLVSSAIFLVALAMIYAATGTVNLAQLAERLPEIDPTTSLVLEILLMVAFGIKAAIFPLSAWLPDSYPTAPAPVTAVFAGLLTKVGIYAIIRTQTMLFPDGRTDDVLLVAALLTMLVGILGAVAQDDIKRLLSFTLVSHIGYMLLGIALSSQTGLTATVFYVVHHITVQTTLFLVVGLMERVGGTTSLARLGGLAKIAPLLAIAFFVPAMNLAGIPPLSGFLGKVGLLQGAAQLGTPLAYTLLVGGIVTSLLTLYAIVKAWNKAFWQTPPQEIRPQRLPAGMFGPTVALVAFGLSLTFAAGPLFDFAERASVTLRERTPYVDAVLGADGRGQGTSNDLVPGDGSVLPSVAPDDADGPVPGAGPATVPGAVPPPTAGTAGTGVGS